MLRLSLAKEDEVEVEADVAVEVILTLKEEVLLQQVDIMDIKTMISPSSMTIIQREKSHVKSMNVEVFVKFAKNQTMKLLIVGTGMIILINLKIFLRHLLLLL